MELVFFQSKSIIFFILECTSRISSSLEIRSQTVSLADGSVFNPLHAWHFWHDPNPSFFPVSTLVCNKGQSQLKFFLHLGFRKALSQAASGVQRPVGS